jgi:hypothetical protein
MLGEHTSEIRVDEISQGGFWLSLAGERLYLAFDDFPWFAGCTGKQLGDVQWPSQDHLYWPSLDIDLSVASIRDPGAFPLIAATRP